MKNQVLQQLAIAIIGLLPAVAATPAPAVDRGHQAMIEMLADLGRLRLEDNRYQGESVVTRLTASLAQLPTSAPSKVRVELNYHLGVAELFLGRERAAIDHLRAAVRILPEL